MKKILLLQLAVIFTFSNTVAREQLMTPLKKDYVENGVPFVADVSAEYEETNRSEVPKEEISEEAQFATVIDEDTPVTHEEIIGEKNLTSSRPWKKPDFSKQEGFLGYESDPFKVPKNLETQVKFWIDIYSKYNSDQGVLHDSENIDLIYQVLDFGSITSRTDIGPNQKEARKIKMVKEAKKSVIAMLERMSKLKDPSSLNEKEKKIWDYFQKIQGSKKFAEAAGKNRLRFQLGQKDRVIQGIYFSGRYIEQFEQIFRENKLPIELARLPFVESSYNVLARSKVGASGLWQIMPYTAKGYMKKDPTIDLRNHPIEGTKLAAKLLRQNYNMLKSWPLALTGYNHGPTGVLKLTKKYKTRDIGELVENVSTRKSFGFASRNFYASYLAILEVTSKAPEYLGTVTWSQTLDSVDIKLKQSITYDDVLRWFDGDDLKAQIFNPQITKIGRTKKKPIPANVVVSVPKSKAQLVMKELESPVNLKQARLAAQN